MSLAWWWLDVRTSVEVWLGWTEWANARDIRKLREGR